MNFEEDYLEFRMSRNFDEQSGSQGDESQMSR